jgi:hypothetical protein
LSPSISMVPSSAPSKQPSATPSSLPSDAPTLSLEPTFQPVSSDFRFKLRLYWQPGYFWQEDTSERYWCMECVRCDEYGRVRIGNGFGFLGCGLLRMPCTNCPLCCCGCCCFSLIGRWLGTWLRFLFQWIRRQLPRRRLVVDSRLPFSWGSL